MSATHHRRWFASFLALMVSLMASAALAGVSAQPSPDPGWPRSFSHDGATLVVHQPQVDSWKDQEKLAIKAAVELTQKGEAAAAIGAIWLTADTSVDFDTRTVAANNIKLAKSFFPGATPEQTKTYDKLILSLLPPSRANISLDRLLASLRETVEEKGPAPADTGDVAYPVPDIFYSDHPAALLMFDGAPVWREVPGTQLTYALNTNWDIFQHAKTKEYYLLVGEGWLRSAALSGPWGPAGTLPQDFSKLPASDDFADAKKQVPGTALTSEQVPAVYVAERPAECIVTKGAPVKKAIPGTKLAYLENCDSDVFVDDSGKYYYLVSGRWFTADDLARGPWQALTPDKLPRDFARIPADGPKGPVLASVPGTEEADYAVLQAKIPQKATISRASAKLAVSYAGEPQFTPIGGTPLTYAVNTPSQVIGAGARYYCCQDAAWFVADSPKGPWKLCDSVPKEIYAIPPSSPVYNVTYVKVYDSTAEAVAFGYLAGYLGSIVSRGVVVFGPGYYYPPYLYGPAYFPRPAYFGVSAYYNPYTGLYNRGAIFYGPYGGYGRGAVYNPYTGGYARASAAWGPYGGTGTITGYNPYTGRTVTSSVTAGPYGGVRTTAVQNPYTGRYAVGATSWGPAGVTRAGMAYNPFTGVASSAGVTAGGGKVTATATKTNLYTGKSATVNRGTNGYASWGSSAISTPERQVKTGSYASPRREVSGASGSGGWATASYQGPRNDGRVVKSSNGDLVVGNDGNVYKRQDGDWSKVDGSGRSAQSGQSAQSERASQARQQAAQSPRAQQAREQVSQSPRANQAREQFSQSQRAQQARDNLSSSPRSQQFQDRSSGQSGARLGERAGGQVAGQLDRDFAARSAGNDRAGRFEAARQQSGGFSGARGGQSFGGNREFGGGGRGGGGFGGGRRR